MKQIITILSISLLLTTIAFSRVQITNTSVYYTGEQMLLANEIIESGEPFARNQRTPCRLCTGPTAKK